MSQKGAYNCWHELKSPRLGSPCLIIMTSCQVILWYSERLFWFYAFLSVSMGIWINRGKQQFLAVLCLHFATSLINSILCAAACFCCSAPLCMGLSFIQRCGRGWPQSQWHSGKAQQYRVQSGECLREHSWGGTVPSCQMLVKKTLNQWERQMCERWDRCTMCYRLIHDIVFVLTPSIRKTVNFLGGFSSKQRHVVISWTLQLSGFSFCENKKNVADVLVTSWLVTSLFSLFRFRVLLCTQVQKFLPLSSAFSPPTEVLLIAEKTAPGFCVVVLCIFFGQTFKEFQGRTSCLATDSGFNSRDHMDGCQNQLSVTCSSSWVSLGKARPEGGRKLFTVRLSKVHVSACVWTSTYISQGGVFMSVSDHSVNICMKGGDKKRFRGNVLVRRLPLLLCWKMYPHNKSCRMNLWHFVVLFPKEAGNYGSSFLPVKKQ